MTRVVLGMPLHEPGEQVGRALRTLLAQSYSDFRLVVVDDASSDGGSTLVERIAADDSRVILLRNPIRLGLSGNWKVAYRAARDHCPEADLFAWVGDHDEWEPGWLALLVDALDTHPDAVLAYPQDARLSVLGEAVDPGTAAFETRDDPSPARRLRRCATAPAAGSMVYGLVRADVLERVGIFPRAVAPDRLLLALLAVEGRFVQVPAVLWRRRSSGRPTSGRQRGAIFPHGAPAWSRVPWPLQHAVVLAWRYTVRGEGRPGLGRARGWIVACVYALAATRAELRKGLLHALFALEGSAPRGLGAAGRRIAGLPPRREPELHGAARARELAEPPSSEGAR